MDNFRVLLDTVFEHYQDLLTEAETRYRERFIALSPPSQNLYVRLLTRSDSGTRLDQIQYPDIPDLSTQVQCLVTAGLVKFNDCENPAELLRKITKAELIRYFKLETVAKTKKSDLVQMLLAQWEDKALCAQIYQHVRLLTVVNLPEFDTYRLCFFGNNHQDLSAFVVSELGHVRYENYGLSEQRRYYQTREQIQCHKHYIGARQQLEDDTIKKHSDALIDIAKGLPHPGDHVALQRRYHRLINTIARQLERLEKLPQALELYALSQQHPSRERQARILAKLNQKQDAVNLCKHILSNSHSLEEQEFASSFGSRLCRQLGQPFPQPDSCHIQERLLSLQPHPSRSVETLAAEALSNENEVCFYVENALFNSLFGLYFWDIIFAPIDGAFINPFQRGPLNGRSEYFYIDRKELIEQRLQAMDREDWRRVIIQRYDDKHGVANMFVVWGILSQELLALSLVHIPTAHIKAIFASIAQHPGLFGNGFPDLIRFHNQGYELLEVKAPGDVVQTNQKRWFKRFAKHQIPATLLKVEWLTVDASLE